MPGDEKELELELDELELDESPVPALSCCLLATKLELDDALELEELLSVWLDNEISELVESPG